MIYLRRGGARAGDKVDIVNEQYQEPRVCNLKRPL
jgi:hypothetical protein